MKTRSLLVSFDPEDGRALVISPDGFSAIKVDGVWTSKSRFSMPDLRDNFRLVVDEAEANALLNEAKEALGIN